MVILRWTLACALLVVLVATFGTGPFARALDHVTLGTTAAALGVTAITTLCAAARWSWVAGRLDLGLDVRSALPAYYRSQLLNQVLPGGVVGDVHRAVRHGRDEASLVRAVRAVAWERVLGQAGLLLLAGLAVLALPSVPVAAVALAALAVVGVLLAVRASATLADDVRRLVAGTGPWWPLLLSVLAASGHLVVLLVALHAVRPDVSLLRAAPLLLLVLVASALPVNLAGWGPREGAAASLFGAAGIGAADGITVATVYGVLSLVAALPGVVVLAAELRPVQLVRI